MGKPLVKSSDVECGHQGKVQVGGSGKLTVGGDAVLVAADVMSKQIAGCTTPVTPGGNKPCVNVMVVAPTSLATKLTVGGSPVVLESLTGSTDGVPPGTLQATAGQSKLTAV